MWILVTIMAFAEEDKDEENPISVFSKDFHIPPDQLPAIGDSLYGAVGQLAYIAPIVYKRGSMLGTNKGGYAWMIYAKTTYIEVTDYLRVMGWTVLKDRD